MASCLSIPSDNARIKVIDDDEIRPSEIRRTTACWRQYIGTWEIKSERLYLINVFGKYEYSDLEPIYADWVTHTLRVPQGKQLKYVHMGFDSVYEKDVFIRVENGEVVNIEEVSNHLHPDDEERVEKRIESKTGCIIPLLLTGLTVSGGVFWLVKLIA